MRPGRSLDRCHCQLKPSSPAYMSEHYANCRSGPRSAYEMTHWDLGSACMLGGSRSYGSCAALVHYPGMSDGEDVSKIGPDYRQWAPGCHSPVGRAVSAVLI